MVVIRLKRVGVKHNPSYRVCVADSRSAATAKSIEIIGYHNPIGSKKTHISIDRYDHWLQKGAKPSLTVKNLYKNLKK